MSPAEDMIRRVKSIQKLYRILSKRTVDDSVLASIVNHFKEIDPSLLEHVVDWTIENETELPSVALILERVESGFYSHIERKSVILSNEEREQTYWEEDRKDCGLSKEEYKIHVERWEKENPGLSYFEEIVKRR